MTEAKPAKSAPPASSRFLRFLGCMIKVPLGCLAFLGGGLVMLVLFLPPSLGSMLHDRIERAFAKRFEGSLEFQEIWVGSLYNEQELTGVVLRDPEGEVVFKGDLRAPSLYSLVEGDASDTRPLELDFEFISLEEDAEGRWNLDRALTLRPRQTPPPWEEGEEPWRRKSWSWGTGKSGGESHAVLPIDIHVGMLRCARRGAAELVFEDLNLACTLSARCEGRVNRYSLEVSGASRGGVTGLNPIAFDGEVADLARIEDSAWSVALEGEELPVALLRALFGSLGEVERLVGDRLRSGRLVVRKDVPQESDGAERVHPRIEAYLEDPGCSLVLKAEWDRTAGELRSDGTHLSSVSFPGTSPVAPRVVGTLVPLGEGFSLADTEDSIWVHTREFVIPLDGDLDKVEAALAFTAKQASFQYVSVVRDEFHIQERQSLDAPLQFAVHGGVLSYEGLGLPTGAQLLRLDGDLQLSNGDLFVRVQREGFPDVSARRQDGELVLSRGPQR